MAIKPKIDITAAGYAVVRQAFNQTLQLCIDKLTKAELGLAADILDADMLDEDTPGFHGMLADVALYSRKDTPSGRKKKRAIDRVAPIAERVHDPLRSAIAARLPSAVYSIFRFQAAPEPGVVLAEDLFADRTITIMDNGLAQTIELRGEAIMAGRFVDMGAWHIGFGIAEPLRKSEMVAISLALAGGEDGDDRADMCDTLHELIYHTHLHDRNLVMAALQPMILALSAAIDAGDIEGERLMAGLGSLLSGDGSDTGEADATDL